MTAAEARRLLVVNARYPVEFVGSLVALYGVFFLLHFAARRFPIPYLSFGGDLSGEALGYALWMWSYGVIGSVQALMAADLASGALEPLLAAGVSGRSLAFARAAGFALQSLAICAVLVVVATAVDASSALRVSWPAVVVAYGCGVATSMGFAVAFAGLALRYRRISMLMTPVSILLMWAMMSPLPERPSALQVLPYVAVRRLLSSALSGVFDARLALVAVAVAVLVLVLGAWLYGPLERRAKALGRLSTA
jgi:hypothetical protein